MQTYKWGTVPAEQLNDKMVRRMIVGTKEMLVHWEIKRGTLAARHSHPHEQMVMMVSGKVRLAVGDDETIIGPGDIVVIPPQIPHEGEILEDTVLIDVFSPPREDFLSGDSAAYLKQQ